MYVHRLITVLLTATSFSILVAAISLPNVTEDPPSVDEEYIITLKQDTNLEEHLSSAHEFYTSTNDGDKQGSKGIDYKWSMSGFHAYAGKFNRDMLDKLKKRQDIAAIEKDADWTIGDGEVVQRDAPWHLPQISHRSLGRASEGYVFNKLAISPRIYVIDSGINVHHREFSNRAIQGYNAAKRFNTAPQDQVGHGTFVSAVIGGNKYGVLKSCTLVGVKINTKGWASKTTVILDGLLWAMRDMVATKSVQHGVINMSLGPTTIGLESFAFNRLTEVAVANGISIVVSAGNRNANTFWTKRAIVVGATNKDRRRAVFSSFGKAVSIFAPGQMIESAWIGPNGNEIKRLSGTSFSAPQVSGVLAYLKVLHGLKRSREAKAMLFKLATLNVVGDAKGSQNRFLYNGSGR
ncbi:subtilisin-like proteinase Mp1 [Myriangium duriaei CBS 260.36]|uniref:Subtilisin-like proteinase Mp1 n=1 Tax=Myriangium duriaei CBS 260.36 TaxID=1168546 RepID=A0A9P4MCQ9_9PEZI|nr:subtilisin-like proteinase Mp1 [Myriangium duriaei CBS 260.36]